MTDGETDFDAVERAVRGRTFGTLSTLTRHDAPHATGVVYAVAPPAERLRLYVTTRTSTAKVANIRANPHVAFVIPVPHRLPLFPPRAVQFQGTAEVLGADDPAALRAFRASWFHRRILATEQRLLAEGETLCFVAIRPHATVFTYGIGMSAFEVLRRPRQAVGRTHLPTDR
ncbi:MAG TPA: pyridoxamine 5'-phosphate oxidase family protein [Mycobacterium sp.]